METLKGVFPHVAPPPKRDFLRENVAKIKHIQPRRVRKASNQTEYSKFNSNSNLRPKKKLHGSTASLSTCSSRVPALNNLRKSMSQLSMQSRDFGVQTTDPDDEYFLKDSIIRYPSASTVRSTATSTHQLTCSRGHQLEQQQKRPQQTPVERPRRQAVEKMDRLMSNLSDSLDGGSITTTTKKSKSILKNPTKSNKNLINEHQQKFDRSGRGDTKDDVIEFVDLTAKDEDDEVTRDDRKAAAEAKRKEELLKLAEADPDCPQGHVPLLENERVEALKLAENRKTQLNFRLNFLPLSFLSLSVRFLGFKELIDELNRLPMTCETLRVRNRKIQIEKELRTIEINIRVFSKPKVYVKLN